MTRFGKKSLTLLFVGSVLTAAASSVVVIAQEKSREVKQVMQQVERSEADLAALKGRFIDWQANTPHGKAAMKGSLRIEPVGLDVDFPPSSFDKLGLILGKMYTDDGILKLKKFSLLVGPGGIIHVSLSGQKTFLQE